MVATVELCEANGAGETITHNVSSLNCGSIDAANLVPASYPINAGENACHKMVRVHVTAMGGSNKIDNIQVWKSAGAYATGEGIQTNLRTSSYGGALSYAANIPSAATYTDQTMPVADPAAANLGIGGSLTGSLVAAGYSDYWKCQLQTTGSTPPGSLAQKTMTIQYDEQ